MSHRKVELNQTCSLSQPFRYIVAVSGCLTAVPVVKEEKQSPINVSDTVGGKYKLIGELRRGGCAVIYKVEDKRKGKKPR